MAYSFDYTDASDLTGEGYLPDIIYLTDVDVLVLLDSFGFNKTSFFDLKVAVLADSLYLTDVGDLNDIDEDVFADSLCFIDISDLTDVAVTVLATSYDCVGIVDVDIFSDSFTLEENLGTFELNFVLHSLPMGRL